MSGLLASFKKWQNQPFAADQSALDWFLFMGFLLVCAAAWHIILSYATEEIA